MRTEDGYIVRECINGDKSAFALLIDKYKAAIFAIGSPTLKCGQRFHRLISSFKRSEGLPLGSFQGSNGT